MKTFQKGAVMGTAVLFLFLTGGERLWMPLPATAAVKQPLKGKAVTQKTASPKPVGISVASAEATIQGYMAQIEHLQAQALAIDAKDAIMKRYTQIFQSLGVLPQNLSKVEGHVNVWKHWSGVCLGYYGGHRELLKQSLEMIRQQGYAKPGDMAYLKNGMATWLHHEDGMQYMYLTGLEAFGKERGYGVLSDQYRDQHHDFYAEPYKTEIHMNYTVQHLLGGKYEGECSQVHFSALTNPQRLPVEEAPPEVHSAIID